MTDQQDAATDQQPAATDPDRRYRIQDDIGRGAMGAVYLAADRLTGDTVALKRVTVPAEQLRFAGHDEANPHLALAREFKTLASLRHPNIITVRDYGFDAVGCPYFTMEHLTEAQSFQHAGEGLDTAARLDLGLQLLQALVYLHRRDTLHRDLKPANVLVADGVVKVLDFGLSMHAGEIGSGSKTTAGTFAYMAPELLSNNVVPSTSSDLYAVGVMIFELLAGRHPFEYRGLIQLLMKIRSETADVSILDLEPDAAAVIGKLLAKTPEERYSDAGEVIRDLCVATGREIPGESAAIRESFLHAATFVGRDREIERLTAALDEAREGRGSAWLLGGESGVGKSRLLAELRAQALVRGVSVQRGQAVSEAGGSFQVWRQPVRRLVLSADLDDLEAGVLRVIGPDVDALLEREIPEPPEQSPEAARERLIRTLEAVYGRVDRPTMVILEDLHWSGDESLEMLSRLAASCADRPLLLIAGYRSDERPDLPERLEHLEHLRLERLGDEAIGDLCESMLGAGGRDPRVVELLRRETEGNAFFVVEIVRALAEEAGRLDEVGNAPLPQHIFTGGLQRIVDRRLARISEEDREVLRSAALLGRRPDFEVLAGLHPGVEIEPWIRACAEAAIFEVHDEDWHFAHDKLREGVIRSLDEEQSRDLHGRIAAAILETLPDGSDRTARLAHHYRSANMSRPATEYSLLAGIDAQRNHAYSSARTNLQGALDAAAELDVDDSVRRMQIDALLALVHTALFSDRPEVNLDRLAKTRELLEAIEEPSADGDQGDDRLRRARMHHALGRCYYLRSQIAEAIEAWKPVLPLAQEIGNQELAILPLSVMGRALAVQGLYGRAHGLLARSIEPLGQLGNWADWATTVAFHGSTIAAAGDYEAGLAETRRAILKGEEMGSALMEAAARMILCFLLNMGRDLESLKKEAETTTELSRKSGDQVYLYLSRGLLAWTLGRLGEHDEAAKTMQEARDIGEALGGRVLLYEVIACADAELSLLAGRPEEAVERAERALEAGQAIGSISAAGFGKRVLGRAADALGRNSAEVDAHFRGSLEAWKTGEHQLEILRTELTWGRLRQARGDEEGAEQAATAAARLRELGLDDTLD